ncbi:MAG: hypothetical protein ABIV36_25945 [Sphingobium limneticum]
MADPMVAEFSRLRGAVLTFAASDRDKADALSWLAGGAGAGGASATVAGVGSGGVFMDTGAGVTGAGANTGTAAIFGAGVATG